MGGAMGSMEMPPSGEFTHCLALHFVGRLVEARGWAGCRRIAGEIEALVVANPRLGVPWEDQETLREQRGETWFRKLVADEVAWAREFLAAGCPELERLQEVRRQFRLDSRSTSLLGLAYLCQVHEGFGRLLGEDGWSCHGSGALQGFVRRAAVLLEEPVAGLLGALGAQAALRRLQLLDIDDFSLPAELLEFVQGLCETPLRSLFYAPVEGAGRSLAEYGELEKPLRSCVQLFGQARQDGKGAAVVLYGVPGTGKSTVVKSIAAATGLVPWEVARLPERTEREAGFRWRAMSAAVSALDPASDLIVVDEADALDEGSVKGKAVLTDLLDRSGHCWLFVGNERPFEQEALLRRISFEIEFPRPDEEFRRRLWTGIAAERELVLPDPAARELARRFAFSPGSIQTVCRDARRLSEAGGQDLEAALLEMGTLHARGLGVSVRTRKDGPAWREDCLNVQGGIEAPLRRLRNFARRQAEGDRTLAVGQMCALFAGAPGTGKTELARRLARETGRKLVVRTAADILGSFVGETERNLQQAFRDGSGPECILFLDEVDSILRDRGGAHRGWEVSQVNQLLQEMEGFEGIFLAATNHATSLDVAASRRFQIKLEFLPLRPEQRTSLWDAQLAPLLDGAPAPVAALQRLEGLTPGDFRVVWSQLSLEEEPPEIEEVVSRLEAELRTHRGAGRRLGL